MRILHFLTPGVFPMPGGLEQSVLRIAGNLAEPGRFEAVIYTRRQSQDWLAPHPAHANLELIHLGTDKAFLLEPLGVPDRPTETVPGVWQLESFRLDHLLLVAAIRKRMDRDPGSVHILISFFATTDGFVAQHAAFTLGIPHIAAVQGSDFSRDFRSPYHVQAMQFVVENARLIVTNNREQARELAAAFPAARAFRTIYNAVEQNFAKPGWTPTWTSAWRLAADCGFSFKKGTHILLRAVAELHQLGEPVTLTIAGGDARAETLYWEESRRAYQKSCPGVFSFPGRLTSAQIDALFLSSDLYVSASLAEGCSLSHSRAMTLGIPMVATRTGALPELGCAARHIALCAPADFAGLVSEIRRMMNGLREGTITVDVNLVAHWRQLLSLTRERRDWEEVIEEISGEEG